MALINADCKLCDVILNEPSIIPVINRFGIILGVGDKSIRTVCEEKNLDCEFFVTILNTFINEDYFPENRLKSFCATQIVDYLTLTNSYYQQFQIPNIERHFNSLISQSDSDNNNLELMKQFFEELKKELLSRIERDRTSWFPAIRAAAEQLQGEYYGEHIRYDHDEPDSLEEKLDDLKSLFVIHLRGEYDLNLCHGVIFALYSLEKDIKQHNRIRNRILRPIADAMLKACHDKE
ncbi:helix-turn-helix transcriptional regulator [Barnesiella sp. An22]|uniref:helix-turn-helix transcriptional regulator n=1 Tax=Barnesiella sp. An22 TaxID=1965590 RepID=UPI000B390C62|nr:helix-turn-helix transcriptional regulator [Barnesiella sp. An22]OUO99250.1 helix-turn-helix transcriptional regulator [Barnesiella sp. An22]